MLPFATVSVKHLQVLEDVSYSTARRNHLAIRHSLGVDEIRFSQLAAHWSCTLQELADALLPRSKK